MENKDEIQGQLIANLWKLHTQSATIQDNKDGSFCISAYQDAKLDQRMFIEQIARIKCSFPSLPIEFYKTLSEAFTRNGFTNERAKDAVSHVIDNCVYPQPTVAQFIGYDKSVKLFSYAEMTKLVCEANVPQTSLFECVKVEGKTFWRYK